MTSEWKVSTIGEACSLVTDGSHFSPKSVENGEYMVSVKDFTEYGFDFKSCRKISSEDYETLKRNGCVPKQNDILIGKDGARYFEDIIIYRQPEQPALLSSIAILRCDEHEILPEFLYYILRTPSFRQDVRDNYGSGSAIPRIILKDFKRMPISYPTLEEQKKMVSVLSALDSRIQTNMKINDNLEQQAQALFHAYFPYAPTDDVPTDWRICALSDVTENIRTRVKNQNCTVLSAVNTGKLHPSEEYFTKQVFSKDISNYIVVEENSFAYNPARVNIGSIGINNLGFLGCVSPVYVVFRVEEDYQYFFDFFIKTPRFREEVKTRASGSVRQAMNYSDFGLIPIAYPPKSVIDNFNRLYLPIYRHIEHRKKENIRLAELRDSLLPHLMLGEIDVSDIQI